MDKIWPHGVIKYLQKKGVSPQGHSYSHDVPALSTVQKLAAEFQRVRESLEDATRSGRPATAITQENIYRVGDGDV